MIRAAAIYLPCCMHWKDGCKLDSGVPCLWGPPQGRPRHSIESRTFAHCTHQCCPQLSTFQTTSHFLAPVSNYQSLIVTHARSTPAASGPTLAPPTPLPLATLSPRKQLARLRQRTSIPQVVLQRTRTRSQARTAICSVGGTGDPCRRCLVLLGGGYPKHKIFYGQQAHSDEYAWHGPWLSAKPMSSTRPFFFRND
jgi:hypothetical protein